MRSLPQLHPPPTGRASHLALALDRAASLDLDATGPALVVALAGGSGVALATRAASRSPRRAPELHGRAELPEGVILRQGPTTAVPTTCWRGSRGRPRGRRCAAPSSAAPSMATLLTLLALLLTGRLPFPGGPGRGRLAPSVAGRRDLVFFLVIHRGGRRPGCRRTGRLRPVTRAGLPAISLVVANLRLAGHSFLLGWNYNLRLLASVHELTTAPRTPAWSGSTERRERSRCPPRLESGAAPLRPVHPHRPELAALEATRRGGPKGRPLPDVATRAST